jgi:pSer/pThr/pTyr-binding forkhead associated (FHA) protein
MVALLHPIGQGHQIPVDRAVVLIGRSPECDAVIDFSSKISRLHCALVQVDSTYFIRDLGSMNGVYVAGVRVEKCSRLSNGIEVSIGDVQFQFYENVQVAQKPLRKPVQAPVRPAANDRDELVLDVEVIEDDDVTISPSPPRPPQPRTVFQPAPSATGDSTSRPKLPVTPSPDEALEVIEPEVIEDVLILEDVEPLDIVEVVDDLEVVEDVQVIEDVEIIPDAQFRRRQQRRLR